MIADHPAAKEILSIIGSSGEKGVTKSQISRKITTAGCDCENWINTFLEAGVIEECGKTSTGAVLYRIAKK